MNEHALAAMINHLEAKQMASDFLLEVLWGSYLAQSEATDRDEQLAKISMLARERTTISKSATDQEREWMESLLPDFQDHVDRLCRKIAKRAEGTAQANE